MKERPYLRPRPVQIPPRFGILILKSPSNHAEPSVHFVLRRNEPKLGQVWVNPTAKTPNTVGETTLHSPKLEQLEQVLLDRYEAIRENLDPAQSLAKSDVYNPKEKAQQQILQNGLQEFLPDVLTEIRTRLKDRRDVFHWKQVLENPQATFFFIRFDNNVPRAKIMNGLFRGVQDPENRGKLNPWITQNGSGLGNFVDQTA